jgi:excisionase family DNA binding protein
MTGAIKALVPEHLLLIDQRDAQHELLYERLLERLEEKLKGRQLGPSGSYVASPKEAMMFLGVAREKLYELLNSNELESFRVGGSRKILWSSIHSFIQRRLAAETQRRSG